MKRIGIIGTDNGHAHMYSALINGWRQDEPLPLRNSGRPPDPAVHLWGRFAHRLDLGDYGGRLSGLKVSKLWSADRREAERLARACDIDEVSPTPDDASCDVDAVMVLSEDPHVHLAHARAALKRSIPTYIDKPMAPSSSDAEEIFAMAESLKAPCFTGSALRYAPELLAAREAQHRYVGQVRALYIHCPISIPLYVSHALEVMNLFIGHQIEWVHAIEATGRQVVLLQETSGISIVIDHINIGAHPRYSGSIHGTDDYLPFHMTRLGLTAFAFLKAFTQFVETGVSPSPTGDSLAIMRISEAVIRSLESDKRVTISTES